MSACAKIERLNSYKILIAVIHVRRLLSMVETVTTTTWSEVPRTLSNLGSLSYTTTSTGDTTVDNRRA